MRDADGLETLNADGPLNGRNLQHSTVTYSFELDDLLAIIEHI